MPLEDLIPLGFEVFRPPTGEGIPPTNPSVRGFDRHWVVMPDGDEEAIVAEAKNHKKLYDKLTQAMTYFADNYTNWPTMTAQQKDAANRQAQRALANMARYIRGDLSSEGV